MRYAVRKETVPQDRRARVNEGVLRMIRAGANPPPQSVFEAYTGRGGLHGLQYDTFEHRHAFSKAKQEWEQGQFFTPDWIVRLASSLVGMSSDSLVCDPMCGHGAWFNHLPDGALTYGCEVDPDAADVARYLYPSASIVTQDVRTYEPPAATHILGNPPFGLRWVAPLCPMSNEAQDARSEDVFLWFVASNIRRGGIVAAVTPAGWLTDELIDSKAISFFKERFVMLGEIALPDTAFARFGCKAVSSKLVIFGTILASFQLPEPIHVDGREWGEDTSPDSSALTPLRAICDEYLSVAARYRSHLTLEQLRACASRNHGVLDYDFRKYHYQLSLRDNEAASKQHARWIEAHLPCPAGVKYEVWEKTRLKPEVVVAETKRLVKRQHEKPRPLVRLCKGNGTIFLRSYSPAAAAAMRNQLSHWENLHLARGLTPDLSTLKENLDRLNHRQKKREVIRFEGFNFGKVTRRIRRRYQTWLRPIDECDDHDLRALVEEEFKRLNSRGLLRREELQLREIARTLVKDAALLNWEMGCGKTFGSILWARCQQRMLRTRTAVSSYAKRISTDAGSEQVREGSTLIVSSALSIELNWIGALRSHGVEVMELTRASQLEGPLPEFVVVTHHTIHKLKRRIRVAGKRRRLTQMVVDESDEIGNRSTARTRAALTVGKTILKRMIATGTPARNTAGELFTQLDFVFGGSPAFHCVAKTRVIWNPDVKDLIEVPNPFHGQRYESFRGLSEFRKAHAPHKPTVLGVQRSIATVPNAEALSRFLKCVRSRLTLEQLRGCNPLEVTTTALPLSPLHASVYEAIVESVKQIVRAEMEDDGRKASLLALAHAIRLLQQTCSTPERLALGLPLEVGTKRDFIRDRILNSPADHIAVGTIWKKAATSLVEYLESSAIGRPVFYFDGEASFKNRRRTLDMFMATPRAVLVTTQQSLRSSVNVPCVSEVIAEALPWNFPSLEQWARRFVRYDSPHSKVSLNIITCQDTIEEQILGLLLRKVNVTKVATGDDIACDEELFAQYGIDSDDLMQLVAYLMGGEESLAVAA